MLGLWRGWGLAHLKKHGEAIKAIRSAFAASTKEQASDESGAVIFPTDDALWWGLTHYLVVHQQLDLAEQALLRVQGREEPMFAWAALAYCVSLGAAPEALRLCETLRGAVGPCQSCDEIQAGVLIDDGAFAEAEARLEQSIERLALDDGVAQEAASGGAAVALRLRLLQAFVWLRTDRVAPAVAAFRRLWPQFALPAFDGLSLPPERGHPGIWWNTGRLARILVAFGDGCASLAWDDEALSCYLHALQLSPQPSLFQRACGLLFKHHQFDDAARVLGQAVALFPDSEAIRYGLFLLAARAERWDEARAQLDAIGKAWFDARSLQREWLFGQIQIALGEGDVLGAFVACEAMLDDVLAEPALRGLRDEIVAQLQAQFVEMQQQLGESQARRHREGELKAQLALIMSHHRAQQDAFSQLVAAQELHDAAPRQASAQLESDDPEAAFREAHPKIAASLADDSRSALTSALFLWGQLSAADAAHHDFGPVILQLARAVEGEINRWLIDPLLGLALKEGGALGDFPPVSIGALAPEGNHLSLGDAARLLYHSIEVREADGSISMERNPHSHDRHLRWLQRWWQSPPCVELEASSPTLWVALQQQLPRDLQKLAGLRNQAGHAGAALSQKQAKRAMDLVLGQGDAPGLLHLTSALARDH